eukprot:CCRYP_010525-RA/>CCRYP_010525-RA protein AED:0.01 eAED:0.01 QI:921/1/1/1/1/1/3/599/1584
MKTTKSADAAAGVAESEREEMEERYERVVLSVLMGLGSLVECEPENENSQQYAAVDAFPDSSSVVRMMQSSRGSFRRETYNLVGKFCQFAPSLVLPPGNETERSSKLISLATLIPNLLASEKDPSNFVSLLELILTYVSLFRGRESAESTSNTNLWESMDPSAFTKALSKALRRACCGAPATYWGPMILPMVASLPQGEVEKGDKTDHPFPLVVVEGLWEGRKSAVGAMDTSAILSSVAECVTYLMLRRPKDSDTTFTTESWTACGQLFLDCLSYFLNEAPYSGFGPGASSLDELCTTIARDLIRLDAASFDDGTTDRGITQIQSFFWNHNGMQKTLLLAKRERQTNLKLIRLMSIIISLTPNAEQPSSHLLPSLKALFSEILVSSDARGNKSCTKEEVELILKIIQFCGAQTLFPIQKAIGVHPDTNQTSLSLEEFCVNNLIRWILIHATTAPAAIPTDFNIGKLLLLSIRPLHQQRQVWETILRELIKSFCDVSTLATGLCAMASDSDDIDLIRCRALDQFANELGNIFMDNFRRSHDLSHQPGDTDDPAVSYQGDMSLFFNSCVGIFDRKSILVSSSVIKQWVDLCCYESKSDRLILDDDEGSNSLLKALLLLGSSSENGVLTRDELVKLVIQSWVEGGKIWQQAVKNYHLTVESGNEERLLRDQIISAAALSLREDIRRKPPSDHAVMELTCQAWSKKAVRLLEISESGSLQSLGIDMDLCEKIRQRNDEEFLFLNLMYLLHSVDSYIRCRELLLSGSENQELFVNINSSIVDRENALLQPFQDRTQRNTQLIETLGGPSELTEYVQNCVVQCVDLLACHMKADKENDCDQILTALSYLVSLLFPSKWSSDSGCKDSIVAKDVKEGDTVWYEKAEGVRVKATIVKVHTDDFPNLYFTIKEENSPERQTVANRLRRNHVDSSEVRLNENTATSREYLGRYMIDHLVRPFVPTLHSQADLCVQHEVSAECINIVLSQIGMLSVGIGSVRYEIFQILSSVKSCFCEVIRNFDQHLEQASSVLRYMALAMGYGRFTKSSARGNLVDLKLSTDEMFTCLLDLYDDHSASLKERTAHMKSFHVSVAMWLAVATNEARGGDILRRLSGMISFMCDVLLSDQDGDSSMILMKAIIAFQVASKNCMDYSSVDSIHEKYVFQKITHCFVNILKTSTFWVETYASILKYYAKEVPGTALHAANIFSNDLYECLKFPMKRWCAFQLLMLHAKAFTTIISMEDVVIPSDTEVFLSEWKAGLDEEEATELEGDVRVAAAWLSGTMMTHIQDIGRCTSSSLTPESECYTLKLSEILVWMLFLEIFDNAGAVDMRNRSSISAFLQKTKATGAIMILSLQEADLDVGRKENIFECINPDFNSDLVLREVATLAVFRTIESLPTLVKSWFHDDCPRYSQQKLITFVENKVAPETLQRELVRIKDATSFGDMSVSGSAVSREVVATYQQDECQLSVTIRIPSTFPLRNVEVDCQKTLGIAEKRWRRWALNIMMMLNNQDGSILDALLLWKENVDKEFDGVEPCPVCYSVLCIKTHSMPNLQCKTCNNRFHSLCLHKWFQSSGKSNCVLCQQPWSGIKVA